MNKKLLSVVMSVIITCYPLNALKASQNLSQTNFYIPPDYKQVELRINSPYAMINQKEKKLSSAPIIIEDKLYIPFRFIRDEMFDLQADFDAQTKTINLSQYKKSISLTEGKKIAYINGQKIAIDAAPLNHKGTLFIPFKFLCEQLDIPFTFDAATKTIQLTFVQDLKKQIKGSRPTAKFYFKENHYIAGESIEIIDESFDKDGDLIIGREWQIDDQIANRISKLDDFLQNAIPGEYNISLRVKDNKNYWSEWFTQSISILPNQPPEISEITLSKHKFAQGEEIEIGYTYENEEWEPIVEELWSYRLLGERNAEQISTQGKPKALFYPGEFIIELRLKDAYGNISEKKEERITITDQIIQTEIDYKFKKGIIGSTIDNYEKFNYQNYQVVDDYTVVDTGAKLLMSNSPESVSQKGILYQDTVQGAGRILYHHKNIFSDQTENKRLVVVIENKNEKPITVVKRRQGVRGPSEDVLYIGAHTLMDFLNQDFYQEYYLLPGEKQYFQDTGNRQWYKGNTVSGMIELYSNEEVHITVAVIGEHNGIHDLAQLPILPKDGIHTRGSFENADRYYQLNISNDQPYKLMLGLPANGMEEWLVGYDALTGERVVNKGNYGMLYALRLNVKEDTGVLFNVRSNIYKGAISYTGNRAYLMPENGFVTGVQQSFVAGIVNKQKMSELIYVLPNGSAAPVLFCFIPKSQWNK